jgi:hypothetical protein
MAKIRIDLWGRTEVEPNFNIRPEMPFEVDAPEADGDGVIYRRFFDRADCMVHRTTIATAAGRQVIKTDVGYGKWADRASLAYGEAAGYPKTVEA